MIQEQIQEQTLKELFDNIEFKAEPQGLYEPLKYMMSIGGKRIRPRLCLLTYSMFADSFSKEILEPAAALEIFHTFTLLHDDIMDKSPLRRGKETVWKKWGEDTAILSGDVMSIESYRRMAMAPGEKLADVLSIFTLTAAQVCEGQQYDMEFEDMPEVSMEEYTKMIGLKTAVLIACSAKIGAIIAGASEKQCDSLYTYGYDLGLAFQIADDYLDAYGDEKVFGKPIGGDIVNNKKSWLLTRAFEFADEKQKAKLFEAMEMPVDNPEQKQSKIAAVKSIFAELNVAQDAQNEIRRLSLKALDAVKDFELYDLLKNYADGLIGRVK